MSDQELLQALSSQAKALDGIICEAPDFPWEPSLEIRYSEWEWNGCTVRRYLEDGDFWVLLPGFNSWCQLVVIDE